MKQKLVKGDKIPYAQIANVVLNDPNLSFKAKGVYAYLYSKDDKYDFAAKRIAKDSCDGTDSVLAGLKELEEKGYLERKKQPSGRVDYTIHIAKTAKPRLGVEPKRENPIQGKSLTGKIPSITNLDKETNKEFKQTFFSEKKKKLDSSLEILNPFFDEVWDKSNGDRETLLKNMRIVVKRGDEIISRVPSIISDFISSREQYGEYVWKDKHDFMTSMKNLTREIVGAEVDTVSARAWNSAIAKTEMMDMATIRTVIKSL